MKYEHWFANIRGITNRRKIEIRQGFRRIKELYYTSEAEMAKRGITRIRTKDSDREHKKWTTRA